MLNELAKEVHETAVDRGWWNEEHPRSFAEQMMLVVTEVSEAVEAYREGYEPAAYWFANGKPEGIPSELADVIIRVLDTCAAYGVDIDSFIALKMKYNQGREYRHGNKRL